MTSHLTMDFERFNPNAQDPGTKRVYKLNVASLPGGEMLRLAVLVAKGADPGPTLVAFGGVHGDEYEGPHAAKTVYRGLDPAQLSGTFIAVPQCNVPAFATGTRTSPIDGLNLARIFPGDADGTVTERIAWNLAEHVIARANFLIDLHSSGAGSDIATLIGYYMSDDEMGQKSLAAARAFGMPVMWGHPDLGPGRSITYGHARGIPWLYTESRGGGWLNKPHAGLYARGITNVLKQLGVLDGEIDNEPPERHLIGDGNNDATSLPVQESGYFIPEVDILDRVKKGDPVGRVEDLAGETIDTVRATEDGTVVVLRKTPSVTAGDGVCVVTGEKPI